MNDNSRQVVWTVLQTDEDGIVEAWMTAFGSQESALNAIEKVHRSMWKDADMGEDLELIALPTDDEHTMCILANQSISWTTWAVTKTEVAE